MVVTRLVLYFLTLLPRGLHTVYTAVYRTRGCGSLPFVHGCLPTGCTVRTHTFTRLPVTRFVAVTCLATHHIPHTPLPFYVVPRILVGLVCSVPVHAHARTLRTRLYVVRTARLRLRLRLPRAFHVLYGYTVTAPAHTTLVVRFGRFDSTVYGYLRLVAYICNVPGCGCLPAVLHAVVATRSYTYGYATVPVWLPTFTVPFTHTRLHRFVLHLPFGYLPFADVHARWFLAGSFAYALPAYRAFGYVALCRLHVFTVAFCAVTRSAFCLLPFTACGLLRLPAVTTPPFYGSLFCTTTHSPFTAVVAHRRYTPPRVYCRYPYRTHAVYTPATRSALPVLPVTGSYTHLYLPDLVARVAVCSYYRHLPTFGCYRARLLLRGCGYTLPTAYVHLRFYLLVLTRLLPLFTLYTTLHHARTLRLAPLPHTVRRAVPHPRWVLRLRCWFTHTVRSRSTVLPGHHYLPVTTPTVLPHNTRLRSYMPAFTLHALHAPARYGCGYGSPAGFAHGLPRTFRGYHGYTFTLGSSACTFARIPLRFTFTFTVTVHTAPRVRCGYCGYGYTVTFGWLHGCDLVLPRLLPAARCRCGCTLAWFMIPRFVHALPVWFCHTHAFTVVAYVPAGIAGCRLPAHTLRYAHAVLVCRCAVYGYLYVYCTARIHTHIPHSSPATLPVYRLPLRFGYVAHIRVLHVRCSATFFHTSLRSFRLPFVAVRTVTVVLTVTHHTTFGYLTLHPHTTAHTACGPAHTHAHTGRTTPAYLLPGSRFTHYRGYHVYHLLVVACRFRTFFARCGWITRSHTFTVRLRTRVCAYAFTTRFRTRLRFFTTFAVAAVTVHYRYARLFCCYVAGCVAVRGSLPVHLPRLLPVPRLLRLHLRGWFRLPAGCYGCLPLPRAARYVLV